MRWLWLTLALAGCVVEKGAVVVTVTVCPAPVVEAAAEDEVEDEVALPVWAGVRWQ